jgi:excisionase family DNA binding protein
MVHMGTAMNNWMDQAVISVEETALVLGIGRSAAYEAVRRGEIKVLRIGRRILVPTAWLKQLIGADR